MGLVALGIFADGKAGAGWNGVGVDSYLGVAGQGVTGLLAAAGYQPDWPAQMQAQAVGLAASTLFGFFVAWLLLAPPAILLHLLRPRPVAATASMAIIAEEAAPPVNPSPATGRQLEPTPGAAGNGERGCRRRVAGTARRGAAGCADVVERAARFLLRLHFEQPLDVRAVVVAAPPDTEGSGQQSFLNVEPDRAARDAGEVGQFVDVIAPWLVAHDSDRQLLSHCQLSCSRKGDSFKKR